MGNITAAIEKVVRNVLANLDVLIVNRIRSRDRHDLTIENGAGAFIKLQGDTIIMSSEENSGKLSTKGTTSETFTIDIDNISGTAAFTALWFNRGNSFRYAGWAWYESPAPGVLKALRTGAYDKVLYPCSIAVDRIYFGNDMLNPTWIGLDYNSGNLVIHTATGKGLVFEEGST